MNSPKVKLYRSTALALFFAVVPAVFSQTPAVRPLGVISAIDEAAKKLTLKTDAGPEMAVILDDATAYLRIPLGEKSLLRRKRSNSKP